ncbi:hypothetical protein BU24DRAFT_207070 [Aaosphaeria arxii CBS 175.79]|uniref:EDC4-like protein pdc1 beta-propeller domain-containing protein n=1 Tax=Aaosphaeria arxii CBS 175.79 TaxID=1450172 RepID=A0A6A5XV88_9PLEO|nr:uncharacterized protein BU24DRAFT_207070 [Aaosphaeria arxii CBS 175.79]KAF2016631.1 hypothetical protein BU24DRAFT_207070 [Aaosphaeria arxii CBS 175.79]
MSDLQELFARLNGQGAASPAGVTGNQPGYRQPSVSSPIFSPSPGGPQPHHGSAIMSPNSSMANTPVPEAGAQQQQTPQQQSAQLLNLLRFNAQPSQQSIPPHRRSSYNTQVSDSAGSHGRQPSASDLVASFMSKAASPPPQHSVAPVPAVARSDGPSGSSDNPQDILLRLLNHPKPAQPDSARPAFPFSPPHAHAPETAVDDLAQDFADAEVENLHPDPNARDEAGSTMPSIGSDIAAGPKPTFTYVNPFDKLEAASPRTTPRNRTPVPSSSRSGPQRIEILKPRHAAEVPFTSGQGQNNHAEKHQGMSPAQTALPHETVAEAVSDLAEQIGEQVDEALAEAELQSEVQLAKELENVTAEDVKEIEEAIIETAVEMEKELQDNDAAQALEETVGEPVAEALKEVVSQISQAEAGDIADSWESAEAEDNTSKEGDETVIVYRFPMTAFSSLTIQNMPEKRATFRPGALMDIARLKKEFDQIDRSLVSASKNFIVYALVKKGGFKIIRQENGQYRQVFENHQERIFNIAMCTNSEDLERELESILGIGVNGSVFWTSLEAGRDDHFSDNLDTQGIVLPPSPSQDDNTSGGQLKTRAKPSSRHPEFFAVGRGKSIHIVWPKVAAQYVRGGKGICHTEKYLKERSLKILTGKAGKDFTFSEDDTVIVSLDKAGRMRFWDIRRLTDPSLGIPANPPHPVEVSETLLEFHTTSPSAKSWPTSVFFFDKDKPFSKGIALRYVMVGMKQNHSFQLWDLGLGKAVQEINLPHEKESDAICSVSFHPKTGIMAVAHPTRNSIFFIHVSCPRYNLPVMNQAVYISRLAGKGERGATPFPPVNATAIMTSIAEYSFAPKGEIRSLHMLNEPAGPPDSDDPDDIALFELYVMHSKGVCTIRVRRSDLGWKKEGEPLHPRDAKSEGIITMSQLKPPQSAADESSTGGDTPAPKSTSDRSVRESIKKESSNVSRQSMTPEAAMRASTLAKVESKQDAARAAIMNGGEKSEKEKKKKKRSAADTASQISTAQRAPPPSYAQAAQAPPLSKSPTPPEPAVSENALSRASETEPPEWAKKLLVPSAHQSFAATSSSSASTVDSKRIEEIVQTEVTKVFTRELEVLYKRIDEDKRVMNASNGARQEAVLRLVSSTLTDNVEEVLKKKVEQQLRDIVLPKILTQMSSAIDKSVSASLKGALGNHLAKEVPEAVSRALKSPQIAQSISEAMTVKIANQLEPTITGVTGSIVNPALTSFTTLVETQIGNQLRQAQAQRQEDAAKIAQLTDTVQALTDTIQSMAGAQSQLQAQLAKLQQYLAESSQTAAPPRSSPQVAPPPAKPQKKTPEQLETEEITRLLTEGDFEHGTMKWLQSSRTTELFNTVFVQCNPAYLSQVTPLLNLSTGAVVTDSLDQFLPERLVWLDAVLKNVNPHDPETSDIVPRIMEVMTQRLTATYIRLNENSPGNPLLRRISALVTKVNGIARSVAH